MNAINYKTLSVSEEGLYIDVSHYLNNQEARNEKESATWTDSVIACIFSSPSIPISVGSMQRLLRGKILSPSLGRE
jgi:hypothetical protein